MKESTKIVCNNVGGIKKIIYYLMQNSEIVYVGMSLVGLSRAFTHTDKIYSDVIVYDVSHLTDKEVSYNEERLIVKHQPMYNKTLSSVEYMSLDGVKNRLRNLSVFRALHDKRYIKEQAEALGIKTHQFNNRLYYKNDEAFIVIENIVENNKKRS